MHMGTKRVQKNDSHIPRMIKSTRGSVDAFLYTYRLSVCTIFQLLVKQAY